MGLMGTGGPKLKVKALCANAPRGAVAAGIELIPRTRP